MQTLRRYLWFGPYSIGTLLQVEHWLNELCEELSERLQSDLDINKRIAHTLTLHATAFKVASFHYFLLLLMTLPFMFLTKVTFNRQSIPSQLY